MDSDEIIKIINNPNRESLTIDFKKSDVLKEDGLKKLLKHIVSFANRNGGIILIGILDNGTFEGKKNFNVKEVKQDLNNLIHDKIRPVLSCDIQFIPCDEGDVIVVSIPKMKEVPHAVVKLKNGEVESRKYYIRTPDGKRLVSDRQLQYLFKNVELDFLFPFKFTLKIYKIDLNAVYDFEGLPCLRDFDHIFNDLTEIDKNILKDENYGNISHLFPYLMLCSISRYLNKTWAIRFTPDGNIVLNSAVPKKKLSYSKIPLPQKDSKLFKLSLNLREYFKEPWLFHDFYLPLGVKLNIHKTLLSFEHKEFSFKLAVQHTDFSSAKFNDYSSLTLHCFYDVKFNFPEYNYELYENYHQLALAIKRIIQMNWDYESYLEINQFRLLDSINKKLDRI